MALFGIFFSTHKYQGLLLTLVDDSFYSAAKVGQCSQAVVDHPTIQIEIVRLRVTSQMLTKV